MCDKMQFSEYLIFKQRIKQIKEMTLLDMAGAEGQGLLSSFISLPPAPQFLGHLYGTLGSQGTQRIIALISEVLGAVGSCDS